MKLLINLGVSAVRAVDRSSSYVKMNAPFRRVVGRRWILIDRTKRFFSVTRFFFTQHSQIITDLYREFEFANFNFL